MGEARQGEQLRLAHVGYRSYAAFFQYLENFEGYLLLRDQYIWLNVVQLLLEDLYVLIFLANDAIDVHVERLLGLIATCRRRKRVWHVFKVLHEAERAPQQQYLWVFDKLWHAFLGQVLEKDASVDALAHRFVLVIDDLDVDVLIEVHAVLEVPRRRLHRVNCPDDKLLQVRLPFPVDVGLRDQFANDLADVVF